MPFHVKDPARPLAMPGPGWLLALETSSPAGSLALWGPGGLFGQLTLEVPNGHSAHMAPAIAGLLSLAEITVAGLSAVAVSAGPGSYTGLRIGAALAKGLCAPWGLPLLAMSTLELLAHAYRPLAAALVGEGAWIVPMMDARRQEVFVTAYEPIDPIIMTPDAPAAGLVERRDPQALILDQPGEQGLAGWLPADQPALLCGSGAAKAGAYLSGHLLARVAPVELEVLRPSLAGVLARHCAQSFYQEEGGLIESPYRVDLSSFEPAYLKPFMGTRPGGGYKSTPAVR